MLDERVPGDGDWLASSSPSAGRAALPCGSWVRSCVKLRSLDFVPGAKGTMETL